MWLFHFSFILISTVLFAKPELQQRCRWGQLLVNGKCLSFAAPGSPCMTSEQCIDSSICNNNRCDCTDRKAQIISGYCIVPSTSCALGFAMVNGQCVLMATPEKECVGDGQCVGGSRCLNTTRLSNQRDINVCRCNELFESMNGYCIPNPRECTKQQVLVNNICYNLVDPGEECEVAQQCIGEKQCVAARFTNRRICADGINCPLGQVTVYGMCLDIVRSGGYCQDSQQCADNGRCLNGICQSRNGNNGWGNVFPSGVRPENISWQ